jgi:hypothetical protein
MKHLRDGKNARRTGYIWITYLFQMTLESIRTKSFKNLTKSTKCGLHSWKMWIKRTLWSRTTVTKGR